MTNPNMTLKEFDLKLRNHDWYWEDGTIRVERWAQKEHLRNTEMANLLSPDHARLYDAWSMYMHDRLYPGTPRVNSEQLLAIRSSLGVFND